MRTDKPAGGDMRRKRLNIIFFSVLMLAATPRVMTNFNSYAGALYQKAEAEWLHFLLGFAHSDESDKSSATPKQIHDTSVCPLRMVKAVQPSTAKSGFDAKKSSRPSHSLDRSFDFTVAAAPSTPSDEESAAVVVPMDRAARRHISRTISLRDDPSAVDRDIRAKAEYLKILIRTLKLGDSKAVRALKREVAAVASPKTSSFVSVPVEFDKSMTQSLAAESVDADCDSNVDLDSSDNSTLDAH